MVRAMCILNFFSRQFPVFHGEESLTSVTPALTHKAGGGGGAKHPAPPLDYTVMSNVAKICSRSTAVSHFFLFSNITHILNQNKKIHQ